jgi:hypothetical protein
VVLGWCVLVLIITIVTDKLIALALPGASALLAFPFRARR